MRVCRGRCAAPERSEYDNSPQDCMIAAMITRKFLLPLNYAWVSEENWGHLESWQNIPIVLQRRQHPGHSELKTA